jgi:hypothetical protein
MSLSRRQRRGFAKSMGLLGKEKTVNQLLERTRRANEFGNQLHTRHLEEIMNNQREIDRQRRILSEEIEIESLKQKENSGEKDGINKESFTFLTTPTSSEIEASADFDFPKNNG